MCPYASTNQLGRCTSWAESYQGVPPISLSLLGISALTDHPASCCGDANASVPFPAKTVRQSHHKHCVCAADAACMASSDVSSLLLARQVVVELVRPVTLRVQHLCEEVGQRGVLYDGRHLEMLLYVLLQLEVVWLVRWVVDRDKKLR
mmetsp:Transcript_79192/g.157454  ORF Transcript_79192/g.157454 Transcript_79192/m.157454 type:complete len:148 (-) Transcript_79192:1541-1984(-)